MNKHSMQLELEFNEYDDYVDDEAYWSNQPQVILPNFSNYVIYPKQGRIWSLKSNRWVGAKNNKTSYWHCTLYGDDGTVWCTYLHRVIWQAVNGDIPKGYEVNHRDENPSNNIITNLNLMTPKENINWATHNERSAKARSNHPQISKQVAAYKNDVLVMTFPSTMEAQRNGYNSSNISKCCRGCFNRLGNNTYKGYQWQYI